MIILTEADPSVSKSYPSKHLLVQSQKKKPVNDVLLVISLLTLNIFYTFSSVSIVDFEQTDVSWDVAGEPDLLLNNFEISRSFLLLCLTLFNSYGVS